MSGAAGAVGGSGFCATSATRAWTVDRGSSCSSIAGGSGAGATLSWRSKSCSVGTLSELKRRVASAAAAARERIDAVSRGVALDQSEVVGRGGDATVEGATASLPAS